MFKYNLGDVVYYLEMGLHYKGTIIERCYVDNNYHDSKIESPVFLCKGARYIVAREHNDKIIRSNLEENKLFCSRLELLKSVFTPEEIDELRASFENERKSDFQGWKK